MCQLKFVMKKLCGIYTLWNRYVEPDPIERDIQENLEKDLRDNCFYHREEYWQNGVPSRVSGFHRASLKINGIGEEVDVFEIVSNSTPEQAERKRRLFYAV